VAGSESDLTEDLKRTRLFFVSYAPLWLMVALRALPKGLDLRPLPWTSIAFGLLFAWSVLDGIRLVGGSRRLGSITRSFVEIEDQGGAVGAYLATYLLPFLGVTPTRLGDWLAYGVYFIVAVVIFVRTDLALVNPTLYLLGWRVVAAREAHMDDRGSPGATEARRVIVLCQNPTRLLGEVDVVQLAGCYVTKRE
jgi:hypothetical protein